MTTATDVESQAAELARRLKAFIDESVQAAGGDTAAVRPGHRVKLHWPPHPVSYSYHVLASDWSGHATFAAYGETFHVQVARTPNGVFGRCEAIWNEARGEDLSEMLANLKSSSEPLFARQRAISAALGKEGRFKGQIRDLEPIQLLKLLYCPDRDVANDARVEIESHATSRLFTPALVEILRDERHRYRRSAQWCVLDLFEDLPAFVASRQGAQDAVLAIKDLIWSASDDYARTVYKAGVVLGGHLPETFGGPALLECLDAPSKIGRRSAIHGLFHVVEWIPEMRDTVVKKLRARAQVEPDPLLAQFTRAMAEDIASGAADHTPEPVFPEEEEAA